MFKPHHFPLVLVVPVLMAGCAGPEKKLGRGVNNVTEFLRGGEIARSVEQTTLWDGSSKGMTTGFIHGFDRSLVRTAVGAAEVLTFFIPWPTGEGKWTFDPVMTPDAPVYPDYSMATYTEPWGGMRLPETPGTPDSYRATYPATPALDVDDQMGISGGSIVPFFPWGMFKVNEE